MAVRISKLKKDDETIVITQAERIIRKFGSVEKLMDALAKIGCPRSKSIIYRWTYPREKGGTNGMIPTAILFDIVQAARKVGVDLTSEDLDIRPTIKVFNAKERYQERQRKKKKEEK